MWLRDNFEIGPPVDAIDDGMWWHARAYILTLFRNILSIDQSRDGIQLCTFPLLRNLR